MKNNAQLPRNEQFEKLHEMIADTDFAMMTTLKEDGTFHSRPMGTQKMERFDGTLWFFTSDDSPKVDEVTEDPRVALTYANPKSNRFVAIHGYAELVDDQAKIKELWKPIYRAWFPKGLEDPHLSLLRVTVEEAEFWDAPNSKVVQLVGFVKALATGEEYQAGPGEHGKMAV